MGTPTNYMDLVIDLGGQFSWIDCDEYNSSSYRPVHCWSPKCVAAIGKEPLGQDAQKTHCALSSYNPKTDMYKIGGLGEDTMKVSTMDGSVYVSDVDMRRFSFACGVKGLLSGLAKVGGGPYFMHSYGEVSKLLIRTPLVINPVAHSRPPLNAKDFSSQEYFIDVKGIKIDGKPVSFNTSLLSINKDGVGGTMIRTVATYTVLHSAIYKALVTDFVKEAAARRMKRVGSMAPFGACFSSKNIVRTMTGPAVPNIDLVVKGNNTAWSIYGANSMVKIKKNVLCLGFVDGGSTAKTSIVLGGHQLENNLLEFDLASSMLGFSSSLLFHNTSCSQSRLFKALVTGDLQLFFFFFDALFQCYFNIGFRYLRYFNKTLIAKQSWRLILKFIFSDCCPVVLKQCYFST
ncbi:hypothetical protein ACOSQ2_007842 [Xanthoceras sorbifolium]